MTLMTLHIPEWLLWTVGLVAGVPLVVGFVFLAWMGYVSLTLFRNGGIWR